MEVDLETLQAVYALLSPEWRRHVLTLVSLWPVFSLLLGIAKWAVARWVTSPQLRAWFDAAFKVCDLIAINTKSMELRPMAEPKRKDKR